LPTELSPHPVDIHVGARLRLRRKLLGLSQAQLAEDLNLTFQQIQKYERGANRISASTLYALARLLQTPTAWFFEGLPPTDAATKTDLEAVYATGAVQAFLSTPDGLGMAQLLFGLETRRRRGLLDLMSILAEAPLQTKEAA
jgi:transcriptional regulator with XRE-family HTH domain